MQRLMIGCLVLALAAGCASKPPGNPANYYTVVLPPQGAVAFTHVETLQAFTANDTALTQSDASAVSTLGFSVPRGTRLQVLSELDDPALAHRYEDQRARKDCFVNHTGPDAIGEDGFWVQCVDLKRVPKSTED